MYDHDVDELMASHLIYLIERTGRRMYLLPRSPLPGLAEVTSPIVRGWVVEISSRLSGCARPVEKYAASLLMQAYIAYLLGRVFSAGCVAPSGT
jgi:hypothetical protein